MARDEAFLMTSLVLILAVFLRRRRRFFERMRLMSQQMERILFGPYTARQCESLKFLALSERSNEAGGIVNRNGKVLQVNSSAISKPK